MSQPRVPAEFTRELVRSNSANIVGRYRVGESWMVGGEMVKHQMPRPHRRFERERVMPHSHRICLIMKVPFTKYPTGLAQLSPRWAMPEGVKESARVQLCGTFAVELSGRRIDNRFQAVRAGCCSLISYFLDYGPSLGRPWSTRCGAMTSRPTLAVRSTR